MEPIDNKWVGRTVRFVRSISSWRWLVIVLMLVIPVLYLVTLARGLVLGDPTEYTFVASVLGIAHPPGYAFITLIGKLFQVLIPFGEIPWRTHLLSAVSATIAVLFIFGTIRTIGRTIEGSKIRVITREIQDRRRFPGIAAALFASLVVATAVDFWQHAIHTNPHIITATFMSANMFFLTKWWAGGGTGRDAGIEEDGDQINSIESQNDPRVAAVRTSFFNQNFFLLAFGFSAGLGVTHHPLTVFSFPAYALFILWTKPGIWRDWRLLLKLVASAILGLSVWLYYPIRSPMAPVFGPSDMNTISGFLDHVLARGLTESLPFYSLADQGDRALVFWSLLRLQYSLSTILLAALGGLTFLNLGFWISNREAVAWRPFRFPFSRATFLNKKAPDPSLSKGHHTPSPIALRSHSDIPNPRTLISLFIGTFIINYAFVINLRQQDIMAYLLGNFALVGLLSGIGLLSLIHWLQHRFQLYGTRLYLLIATIFLLGPILQTTRNMAHISLKGYQEGDEYVEAVFEAFDGQGLGAVLLNDWERMTPLWYSQFVESHWPDPLDVTPRLVATDRPWVQSVFDFLPSGPVFLSGYRPDIVAAGFRLRPFGRFYQVVEPGDRSLPPDLTPVQVATTHELDILAFNLPVTSVAAGEYVPLELAMISPVGTDSYFTPVLKVGQMVYEFTTDSHLITPLWEPGEVVVERFDFAIPHELESGNYPLNLGVRNLSTNEDMALTVYLGQLKVMAKDRPPATDKLLAVFRQRVGLESAKARLGLFQRRSAPWDEPLQASPGDNIHLTLEWKSLALAEESYTVFVHLIDLANRPLVTLDYTPLGGSTPTHLWIPKWLPGQRFLDPYQLTLPTDLDSGTYLIEVGLYEMTGGRRLHMSDQAGNLIGDRYIMGSLVVQ